jgi:hypothetical protein
MIATRVTHTAYAAGPKPSQTTLNPKGAGSILHGPYTKALHKGSSDVRGALAQGKGPPNQPLRPGAGRLRAGRGRGESRRGRCPTRAGPVPSRPPRPRPLLPWQATAVRRPGCRRCPSASGLIHRCSEERSRRESCTRYRVLVYARERTVGRSGAGCASKPDHVAGGRSASPLSKRAHAELGEGLVRRRPNESGSLPGETPGGFDDAR